jgi:cystathionine gamma-synthase
MSPEKRADLKGFSTRSVHAGESRHKYADAITTPVVQSSVFVFDNTAEMKEYVAGKKNRLEYGRYGNPTQRVAEEKLAALEEAQDALLFATGMAAVTTALLAFLSGGDHLVVTDDCYRKTRVFCETTLARLGVETTFVPVGDLEGLDNAMRKNTKVVLAESPTNPHLYIVDLARAAEITARNGAKLLVDSTFATPYNQQPLKLGVDLVIHSGTKYLGGHNDLLAGVVMGAEQVVGPVRDLQGQLGPTIDPHCAYLLLRGLKTLALRVERHNENGLAIASFLENHPKIERVYYPGLKTHPDHAVAKKQMRGFGGVVSFLLKDGLDETLRFIDGLTLPYLGPSLGGVESLVYHPATLTFNDLPKAEREKLGITDNLVRYAAGIEDEEDIIADLEQALGSI